MTTAYDEDDKAAASAVHHESDVEDNAATGKVPSELAQAIHQPHSEIYAEAIARYPNDESIDQADERRLIRKLDNRILPLLGICYFFYVGALPLFNLTTPFL